MTGDLPFLPLCRARLHSDHHRLWQGNRGVLFRRRAAL